MSTAPAHPPVRVINGKKTFIPLENNPDSLARLSDLLGVKNISFHDIWSLDPVIQDDIPRPASALIFIAPAPVYHRLWADQKEQKRHWTDPVSITPSASTSTSTPNESKPTNHTDTTRNGTSTTSTSDRQAGLRSKHPLTTPDAPILWFKQTIGHACGLMSLIHALANCLPFNPDITSNQFITHHVNATSPLPEIFTSAGPLSIETRAKLLYDDQRLEDAHMAVAVGGDTYAPDPSEPNGMHFITFVKTLDGKLWELDGGNPGGPIGLGDLDEDEDVLCEKAIQAGPGRYIKVGADIGIAEFSCVALVLN